MSNNSPNKITEATFIETDNNKNIVICKNKEDMFNKLGLKKINNSVKKFNNCKQPQKQHL